ncbi:Rne/Rng family ribonuclease [Aeromicrobium senzhongii]|uniref:Rne/Rng family ribonuclease n=1 Tax=Aeromicrobium senzhongii TaxID=2663859 RepID=A0ABX6SVB0_9ACTN|nr:Rne/Rng family ribonuclease [Aeromicrobium senzhongii]MTB87779.1 Rne/Rng family ribonuclease [Aeromicrobium senzhongii]QNL95197.1 Rne/Rng family ribonuclease [Aeromicrobium senzhongii]
MLDPNDATDAPDTTGPDTTETTEAPTRTRRRAAGRPAGPPAAVFAPPVEEAPEPPVTDEEEPDEDEAPETAPTTPTARKLPPVGAMFQPPPAELAPPREKKRVEPQDDDSDAATSDLDASDDEDGSGDDEGSEGGRRRRRRGGRRRRKSDQDGGAEGSDDSDADTAEAEAKDGDAGDEEQSSSGSTRRRRRRARAGEGADGAPDDPENTVVKVREGRTASDEITGVTGSTRLEAKKQRRREGREAGRRRAPIVSEAEFLARREAVDREMVVRQRDDYTQIAVLEDGVLVEHYVARESQTSLIGNVYLGKVQNVLPSMEAAFVDIGAGRNAVIYAGEVDWSNIQNGKQRKIEDALQPGQTVLVQVSKDPIGQKGARLTSQISLPGRFLVYVPGGGSNGISRKLPENERARLKGLLKEALPESAGVIVRTAAEGATEDQLQRDITALTARWEDIESKAAAGKAPQLLYSEPDLMIKVIRDLFNEDFATLTIQGDEAWDMVAGYIAHVAPDLEERVKRWEGENDIFAERRLDEQIHKALDRKVHLPSGGSLVIDRTEAMVVVDVNTGRFTGSGGNLEETVTKNNLEAAEEIVRQLRLRDLGGIIVIDFIDMVLESNRDLVMRRLVECLGRDRTRHQVAEVTSLGLVQMTRKRIGTGLLESFSHECEHCHGRGVVIEDAPVEPKKDDGQRRGRRGGRSGRSGGGNGGGSSNGNGGGRPPRQDRNDESGDDAVKTEEPRNDESSQAPSQEPAAVEAPVLTDDGAPE